MTGGRTPIKISLVNQQTAMPDLRRTDKKKLTFWIPIDTYVRFRKYAQQNHTTMTEEIYKFIVGKTRNIILTSHEIDEVNQEVRKNEQNRI